MAVWNKRILQDNFTRFTVRGVSTIFFAIVMHIGRIDFGLDASDRTIDG